MLIEGVEMERLFGAYATRNDLAGWLRWRQHVLCLGWTEKIRVVGVDFFIKAACEASFGEGSMVFSR